MNKQLTGSIVSTVCFAALALLPIPFQRFASWRAVGGIGAFASSLAGYCISSRKKEEQQAIDLWEWNQQQKQKALEATLQPVIVSELVEKEQVRAKYAIADTEEEMRGNFTILQVERYGEEWLRSQVSQHETKPPVEAGPVDALAAPKTKQEPKTLAAKKAKLLTLIEEHEGGWIGQTLQKPLLVYGDMGAWKSYFVEFSALCRYYLRGHQIVSIADPHFHQNKDTAWACLVKLGVPGFGAHQNYFEVGEQLNAMYDRFKVRTLKDAPYTSIWDEVTGYGSEEGTMEPAKKLIRKIVSDPRKANESPILIAHDNTLAALGAGEGFSKSRDRGIIQLELYSDSENKPLFKGVISGIKNSEGEFIEAQKVSIEADWIRPEWVYELFNSDTNPETNLVEIPSPKAIKSQQTNSQNNKAEFLEEARKWLSDIYEAEVEVASDTTPWDEVSEVRNVKALSSVNEVTSILPEDVQSRCLDNILKLLTEAKKSSNEVIALMHSDADRAVWLGLKLLDLKVTPASRDVFKMGTGGAKFQKAKQWYELLKKEFE